jgi:hypothetical protein
MREKQEEEDRFKRENMTEEDKAAEEERVG